MAASADGRIAVSGDSGGSVRVWDLCSGDCLHVLAGHTDQVGSVAVSADGQIALSAGLWDRTVRVWSLPTGACLHVMSGYTDQLPAVALSADATVAVTPEVGIPSALRVWALDWDYEFAP